MTPLNTLALTILVVCVAVCRVEAFTTTTIRTTSSSATTSSCALQAGRRDFLDAAFSATAGLVIASIPAVARAEEEQTSDDLAMPSVEEQKKADVSYFSSCGCGTKQPAKPPDHRRLPRVIVVVPSIFPLTRLCGEVREYIFLCHPPASSLLHSCK